MIKKNYKNLKIFMIFILKNTVNICLIDKDRLEILK